MSVVVIITASGIAGIIASYILGWEHGKSILRKELEELRRSHLP